MVIFSRKFLLALVLVFFCAGPVLGQGFLLAVNLGRMDSGRTPAGISLSVQRGETLPRLKQKAGRVFQVAASNLPKVANRVNVARVNAANRRASRGW